jgi:thiosulfate/3-mercaptopyruvate sulfurtransferase
VTAFAHPEFLVSTDWLAAHARDADLRIVDATVHLRPAQQGPYNIESGRADYLAGHIPGATFIDVAGELADTTSTLRFTMPSPAAAARTLAAAGIGSEHRIVTYSTTTPMWATRLWWMLRSLGCTRVHVLDGGFRRWRAEGRPVDTGPCTLPPAPFTPRPQPARWADRDEVLAMIGSRDVCTLNALSAASHAGTAPVNYGRPGHIAGSVNVPYASLLDADGRFRQAQALRATLGAAGAFASRRVICYCGGGIAATLTAFALQMLGHADVAVYDGSLTEWVRDPALPMEVGP